MKTIRNTADIQKRNGMIYIIKSLCSSVASSLESGAYVTSFLLFLGLNARQISTIDSVNNAAMLLASILVLFAYRLDQTGVSLLRFFSFGSVILPVSYLISSICRAEIAFIVLLCFGLFSYLMTSARNSVEVNAAPILYGRLQYSRLLGISGTIGGIFTLFVSTGLVNKLRSLNELLSYRSMFCIATVLMLISSLFTLLFRKPKTFETTEHTHVDVKKIFTRKYLIKGIPHIIRGIGSTGIVLFTVNVMTRIELTPSQNAFLIPLSTLAGIAASLILATVSVKIRPGTMVMLSFITMAGVIAAGPFINSVHLYFIFYTILLIANGIGSRSTMASIVFACEKEDLALMSSLHILYYSIAYSPSMILFGRYLESYPVMIMTTAALFLFTAGIMFHVGFRKGIES